MNLHAVLDRLRGPDPGRAQGHGVVCQPRGRTRYYRRDPCTFSYPRPLWPADGVLTREHALRILWTDAALEVTDAQLAEVARVLDLPGWAVPAAAPDMIVSNENRPPTDTHSDYPARGVAS